MNGWRWLTVASVAVTCTSAQHARASDVELVVAGCSLRVSELSRLVTLELAGVVRESDGKSRYRVVVRCSEATILIRLDDPLTKKQVERLVSAPPAEQPEPERVIALTVAQLYRASWLELAADDEPPLSPPAPDAPRLAVEAAREIAQRKLTQSPPRRGLWAIGFGTGLRVRRLASPLILPQVEVLGTWQPRPGLRLFASAGLEAASLRRSSGTVDADLLRGSIGAGAEPLRGRVLSGVAELAVGVAVVQLQGSAVASGFEAAKVSSAGIDGAFGMGMAWALAAARLELWTRVGLLTGTPSGLVHGADDVSLNGAWLGLEARLHWTP